MANTSKSHPHQITWDQAKNWVGTQNGRRKEGPVSFAFSLDGILSIPFASSGITTRSLRAGSSERMKEDDAVLSYASFFMAEEMKQKQATARSLSREEADEIERSVYDLNITISFESEITHLRFYHAFIPLEDMLDEIVSVEEAIRLAGDPEKKVFNLGKLLKGKNIPYSFLLEGGRETLVAVAARMDEAGNLQDLAQYGALNHTILCPPFCPPWWDGKSQAASGGEAADKDCPYNELEFVALVTRGITFNPQDPCFEKYKDYLGLV